MIDGSRNAARCKISPVGFKCFNIILPNNLWDGWLASYFSRGVLPTNQYSMVVGTVRYGSILTSPGAYGGGAKRAADLEQLAGDAGAAARKEGPHLWWVKSQDLPRLQQTANWVSFSTKNAWGIS